MTDFIHYFCVINDSIADPNRKFFVSPVEAYKELERRESFGVKCEVQHRDEWSTATQRQAIRESY